MEKKYLGVNPLVKTAAIGSQYIEKHCIDAVYFIAL